MNHRLRIVVVDPVGGEPSVPYIGRDAALAALHYFDAANDRKNEVVRMFIYPSPQKVAFPSRNLPPLPIEAETGDKQPGDKQPSEVTDLEKIQEDEKPAEPTGPTAAETVADMSASFFSGPFTAPAAEAAPVSNDTAPAATEPDQAPAPAAVAAVTVQPLSKSAQKRAERKAKEDAAKAAKK